jgi:hypothetical protein
MMNENEIFVYPGECEPLPFINPYYQNSGVGNTKKETALKERRGH